MQGCTWYTAGLLLCNRAESFGQGHTPKPRFGSVEHLEQLRLLTSEHALETLKPQQDAPAQRRQQSPVVAGTATGTTLQPSLYGSQPPMLPGRGGPMPSTRGPPPAESEVPALEDEPMVPIPEWALEADLELEKSNILLLVSVGQCSCSCWCSCCSSLVCTYLLRFAGPQCCVM